MINIKCPKCQSNSHKLWNARTEGTSLNQVTICLSLQCNACKHIHQGDLKYSAYYWQPKESHHGEISNSSQ